MVQQVQDIEVEDSNVIYWDGENDAENPLNFSFSLKITNTLLITGVCCVNIMGIVIIAPGVPTIQHEIHNDNDLLSSFVVSIYTLGLGTGPMIFAPLSELIGRVPVYHLSCLGFVLSNICCALATSLEVLVVFRFFSGFFGSVTETNGGGSIFDLYPPHQRGIVVCTYFVGPVIAGIVSPVIGGYVAQDLGWRWIFWMMAILSGTFGLLGLIFLRETYSPVILKRKTARLIRETGNRELRSQLDDNLSPNQTFLLAAIRPAKILIFSPTILSTSIFLGLLGGQQLLVTTTVTPVFESKYHFSASSIGLLFLGTGAGSLLGLLLYAIQSNRDAAARGKYQNNQEKPLTPENRLNNLLLIYSTIPITTLIYGWTVEKKYHWIIPTINLGINSIGNMYIFVSFIVYIINCFPLYAASANTGSTLLRNVIGATLPLLGPVMFKDLGTGWANTVLALSALSMMPYLWAMVRWGEKVRVKYALKNV